MRVLGREGGHAWTLGMFYVAVVQEEIIYGSEIWVILQHIGITLGGFHHRVSLKMISRRRKMKQNRMWVYPLLVEAIVESGLQEV